MTDLPIRFADRVVATIASEDGDVRLAYSDDWRQSPDAFAISLTMPLAAAPYGTDIVLPWLMNLLPEGEPLRAMTRTLGASPDDVLGLISRTGSDLAGALSIAPRPQAGPPGARIIPDPAALEKIITDLPARPFLVDEDGVSMSLAGAQDKLPVVRRNEDLAVPVNGAPSTHILKPDNPRLIGSVQNEALCMVLARRLGLNVAPVTTGSAGSRSYLLVDRYDRIVSNGDVARLHQEDFCQALGRPPVAKYQYNGSGIRGPSLPDLFGLTRDHMTALDTNRLLDAVIFNIAIGNVDSHAKNYSILLTPHGARLAPLYDLMSGLAWSNITENHAQDIGGKRRGLYIHGRHWRRMAEASGLSARAAVRRVEALTGRLLHSLPDAAAEVGAMPAGPGPMLDLFREAITARATEVLAHAGDEGGDDEPDAQAADPSEVADATAYRA